MVWFFLLLLLVCGSLLIPVVRYFLISRPLMHWLKRQQPPITKQEQAMLDSGGVWWEKEIFHAHLDWKKLFSIDTTELTDVETHFLSHDTEELCELLDDWQVNVIDRDLSVAAWEKIKTGGFWGLSISPEHQGHGFSAKAQSLIISKIASRCPSAAIMVMVPNSVGPAKFIQLYGTLEQQSEYLPKLALGEEVGCFALTTLHAGSDATSIKDTGVIAYGDYQGEKALGIRLNFSKRYISLATKATLLALAFKCVDPDHLLGDQEKRGISVALVPTNLPGVQSGARHWPLTAGLSNGPLLGKDVFIPLSFVIGGPEKLGQGWQMMMECLAIGRGLSVPSLAAASAAVCSHVAGAYALVRRQFHRSIGDFEGVQSALAEIAGLTYLTQAAREFTVEAVCQGVKPAIAAAISKYHLTELNRRIVNQSMDVLAGRSVQWGPRNELIKFYHLVPVSATVEGANILTRHLIIFGQGVMRCHPYLRSEIVAMTEGDIRAFDRSLFAHIRFMVKNMGRALWYAITWAPKKGKQSYFLHALSRASVSFAIMVDVALLVVGGKLKIKEALSARLGDMLSHIYLASSALHYFHQAGEKEEEQDLLYWSLEYCLQAYHEAARALCANFPKSWLGKLVAWVLLPRASRHVGPSDALSFRIAKQLQTDSILRDRLTQCCYINEGAGDGLHQLASAREAVLKVQPLWKKIEQVARRGDSIQDVLHRAEAQGKVTPEEAASLLAMLDLVEDVIRVDEFADG